MNRRLKIIGLGVIVGLIVIQLFQPEKNLDGTFQNDDVMVASLIPDSVAILLRNACYDCHSNHTEYLWYSKISPVSWYLDKHIRDGKADLNLSEFGSLEKTEKIGALSDIFDEVEAGNMPLQSYTLIHRKARLTPEEIDAICNWTERESLSIMKE